MDYQKLSLLIDELKSLSPMPGDEELEAWSGEGQHPIDRYGALIENIAQEVHPHYPLEVIPVLLASFGIGHGFEVYWSTVHLIEAFPQEHEVYSFIQAASSSPLPGTRKWCCLLLGRRRSLDDVPFLLNRLEDELLQVRSEALLAIRMLAQCHSIPQAIPAVSHLLQDTDTDIRKAAAEIQARLTVSLQNKSDENYLT